MGLLSNLFKVKPEKKATFPPVPAWQPNTPVNINEVMEKAKLYTNNKLQLAVFKNGTVALFPERVEDIASAAKNTIGHIYYSHPDIKPLNMEDGNYLIQYVHPAFTIVFNRDVEQYWDYIDANHQDGVCNDEVLLNGKGEANVFDRFGKICLFGRAKMFMDAQAPEVVKTFDPKIS